MNQLSRSRENDLKNITVCHRLCFKDSLSVKLGFAYSKKSMGWFLAGDNRFLFHIANANDKTVIGYIGGFISLFNGDGSSSGMIQYAMAEAFGGIILHPWLLWEKEIKPFYPLIFKNISRKLFSKKNIASAIFKEPKKQSVGLVVIGIHPNFRGNGIFEMLMDAFEKEALKRNINTLSLSVKKTNGRALHAYTKSGWVIVKEIAGAYEMTKNIT